MGRLGGKVAIVTTIIRGKNLEGTGITVNEILPGRPTATGMIPPGLQEETRSLLLRPEIVVPPAVYFASDEGRRVFGRRIVALGWMRDNPDGVPVTDGFLV